MLDHLRHSGQTDAELLLTAAKDPGEIEVCAQQIERALFLQVNWVLRGLGRRKPVGGSSLGGHAKTATERRQTRLSIPLS